jgi:hypothetical protein
MPAERRDKFCRDETRETAAERHAREHDHDHRCAETARREFVVERDDDRQHAGDADTGEET